MRKLLSLAVVVCMAMVTPAAASLVNFEYTRAADPTDPTRFIYEMQFWIDVNDPEFTNTLQISSLTVNQTGPVGFGTPGPFGRGFVTEVQSGWQARDFSGSVSTTRIDRLVPGPWLPDENDFFVRFTGVSDVLADMTWNYNGIGVPGNFRTLLSGTPNEPFGFLTTPPVASLTDFNAAVIPLPAALPLLLGGLGGLALLRRRRQVVV
ncbi:VPLPA-CTERM sorting domain-containing protein [Jannaschia sp. CCS1]|uniref:VPLPA-CTERM sorting domain-containing protein n=1 Tax=Jannaschia sp. (strain CCS1) TaxID=290400 RepID=UPI000053A0C0|nr:VPLPA-CTERM sorting domain-containing protein [Jannaschia sp. CCS1]ABD56310.1 hypothetical protein Jann_3393 [Jannaschia sp. CCS1]